MPDGYEDEAREAHLAKAAQAWEDDPALGPQTIGDGEGDSVWSYLRAYYQRIATEDLAPPSRVMTGSVTHRSKFAIRSCLVTVGSCRMSATSSGS